MNAEFIKCLEAFCVELHDTNVHKTQFGPLDVDSWIEYMGKIIPMERIINNIPNIPPEKYTEYIWAVTCVIYGDKRNKQSSHDLPMFVYEVFTMAAALTLYEIYKLIHISIALRNVNGVREYSCKISPCSTRCRHFNKCIKYASIRECITKYVALHNN